MNLSRVYAIVLRHFFLTRHQMERIADMLLFPILGLVLWGFLTSYAQGFANSFASFFIGAMILWVIFERVSTSVGVDFMYDVWERNLINILATGITTFEYIVGLVLVALVKVLISFMAMTVISFVFFHFSILNLGLPIVAFWINLVIFAVTLGIFNVAIVMRWGNSIGPLTWVIPFVIQPFSAVFYPVSVLPKVLQVISNALPIAHVFEGMRYTLGSGNFDSGQFFIALGLNIFYFVVVVAFFAHMFSLVKKKGSLVKL
ncbi:MAG TPA: ABC transporter permease [Candidatus Saccharimonadales bacterium]|nr:ABC transporter permease [Candidatus Saccharimonadales bacterium]